MEFGIFSFVIVFAVLQRKFCDAIPSVTLTGKNTFYDGDNLQLSCAVDEDVDLLSVSFFKGITETIWISNPTSCTFFKLVPEDTSTYSTTCNSKIFTMTKNNLNASDDNTVWSCQMKSRPGGNGSCVGISNPCTSRSITLLKQVSSTVPKSNYTCTVEFDLELGLGTGVTNDIICIICLILIVRLVKIVNNHAKDNLQKPISKGSDVTITASVRGFCKSSGQWIGPHGKISASKEKYSIQDKKKKGISILKIKNLEINDSGFYTCHAKSSCGSLAQDSVRIAAYEKLAVDIDIGKTLRQHGSDVEIICSVYGSENTSVYWTGKEEDQLTGGRYKIASYDSSTNKSSLIVKTPTMTNAEGYICKVAFKESEVSVKIYITLSDKGSLRVSIEKIILFAPASENERREWIGPQKNILTDTGKYAIVPYDSKTNKSHLTIKTFSVNDHGSYTCQSKNNSGTSPKNTITITTNVAIDPSTYAYKFMLGFGIIICVGCIACVVICVKIGNVCALKLGLGLGLGLGIPIIGCIIVIVIWVKKVLKPPQAPENQRNIKSGSRSEVSRNDVEIQMEEKSVKSNEERPLVIRNRIGNKDESEAEQVLSKPFDPKEHRPLPPLNKEVKYKPSHRPQPIPTEKNDVKDQNLRGLSANYDDTQGLASETPRPSKLPPIEFQVQATVQEEETSEGPKKTKKNRRKKEKTDEGKQADETAK
ncbi:hypothetical protein CHS0354_026223 [Potamilus streckersoni]|uniref:Ig-like domain-containing protein n=1 Tax=Potamilus streckersoni TaxID=2493646 RepID=A0AAE0TCF9_9BIVA|nr:hypothetical protein CHS0354_026223 [Potamilus streckersoni]